MTSARAAAPLSAKFPWLPGSCPPFQLATPASLGPCIAHMTSNIGCFTDRAFTSMARAAPLSVALRGFACTARGMGATDLLFLLRDPFGIPAWSLLAFFLLAAAASIVA